MDEFFFNMASTSTCLEVTLSKTVKDSIEKKRPSKESNTDNLISMNRQMNN